MRRSWILYAGITALALAACALYLLSRSATPVSYARPLSATSTSAAAASALFPTSAATPTRQTATQPTATTAPRREPAAKPAPAPKQAPMRAPAQTATTAAAPSTATDTAIAIQDPYDTQPLSQATVNDRARAALVNILCIAHGGSLSPISGSGVIIDPRGIILTNAHVAQYVLLSESPKTGLSCVIRDGAPARARWNAKVLYLPPIWVRQHASEITEAHPKGTGEHDYALLYITGPVQGAPGVPADGFPSLPVDAREAVAFLHDEVLVASYPAEFLGGLNAEFNLYPASSVTAVKQLLTFGHGTVDLLSLGGIIEAQTGSSGGAVANPWGYLVGIVTTMSEGTTTASRDLRAITTNYVDRDLQVQLGENLAGILAGDPAAKAAQFTSEEAPILIDDYLNALNEPTAR